MADSMEGMIGIYLIWDIDADAPATQAIMTDRPAVATRRFRDELMNESSYVSKHPKRFELRCVAQISRTNAGETIITGEQLLDAVSNETSGQLTAL